MSLFGGRATVMLNEIDGIELDCTFIERVNTNLDVSDSPIEVGADVTDHAVFTPIEIIIDSAISNHNINAFGFERNRISRAYDALVAAQKQRKLLVINTGLSLHENMLFVGFERYRTNRTGQVLQFSARFREVVFVEARTVSTIIVPGGLSSPNSGAGGNSVGAVSNEDAPAIGTGTNSPPGAGSTSQPDSSVLADILL